MVLALYKKVKTLKSLVSKKEVITRRKSHRKALNSLAAKSVRSWERVKRRVLLLQEDEDLILELRRTIPRKVFGAEKEEESVKQDEESFILFHGLFIKVWWLMKMIVVLFFSYGCLEREREVVCFWSVWRCRFVTIIVIEFVSKMRKLLCCFLLLS